MLLTRRGSSADTADMGKCKEIGQIAVLKAAAEGVGTAMPHKTANATGIKRKFGQAAGEFSYCTMSFDRRRIHRRVIGETDNTKSKEPSTLNDPCGSCCSSHGSSTDLNKDNSQHSNLEVEEEEESVHTSKSRYGLEICKESKETSRLRDVNSNSQSDEGKMPSSSDTEEIEDYYFSVDEKDHYLLRGMNSSRRSDQAKMPLKNELEEFFSVAENDLMLQFANKYNFDLVKEQPFEGRYKWVRVKP